MKQAKRILLIIWRTCYMSLECLFGFLIAFWCIAMILSRIGVESVREKAGPDTTTVYITSSGVHTDVVVPIRSSTINWQRELHLPDSILHDTLREYLAIGWGDKGFFLETKDWSDLKISVALRAAFHLGSSAMHVVHRPKPDTHDPYTVKLQLSKRQYAHLVRFIKASFTRSNGDYIPIKEHPYSSRDFFFEAKRSYGLTYTCNSWTNGALKSCEQPACVWTAFRDGIYRQYGRE